MVVFKILIQTAIKKTTLKCANRLSAGFKSFFVLQNLANYSSKLWTRLFVNLQHEYFGGMIFFNLHIKNWGEKALLKLTWMLKGFKVCEYESKCKCLCTLLRYGVIYLQKCAFPSVVGGNTLQTYWKRVVSFACYWYSIWSNLACIHNHIAVESSKHIRIASLEKSVRSSTAHPFAIKRKRPSKQSSIRKSLINPLFCFDDISVMDQSVF